MTEETTVPDLYRLAFMPGCFRCPEACPNDGTMMVHVTYREQLEVYADRLKEEFERSALLEKVLAQYRWRPIGEIHEDLGQCVLIRLDDPGYMEVGSNLDEDFNETGWTHFAEVPKLTHEEAERLKAEMPL